jgi:primary-amine oxidase
MAHPASLVGRRAVFATRQLWVTPYSDEQRYPAGEHVVQANRCMGLAEWTRQVGLKERDPVGGLAGLASWLDLLEITDGW